MTRGAGIKNRVHYIWGTLCEAAGRVFRDVYREGICDALGQVAYRFSADSFVKFDAQCWNMYRIVLS